MRLLVATLVIILVGYAGLALIGLTRPVDTNPAPAPTGKFLLNRSAGIGYDTETPKPELPN